MTSSNGGERTTQNAEHPAQCLDEGGGPFPVTWQWSLL